MRSSLRFLPPIVATAVLITACGSSSTSSSGSQGAAASPAALVKAASNAKLGGTVLTTAQGMTLYSLSAEKAGKFICTSKTCLGLWHPLVAPSGSMPTGAGVTLATIKRPDGTEQVIYKGEPLYTFVKDTSPGQANGQGFKDVGTWSAVMSSSTAPAAPVQSSSSSGGSGPYAY